MAEVYLGQIILFAGNFAIKGFALCQGQILSIQSNSALFSILGTTYGGNGTSTFALPDLRSRVPLHFNQGTGLSNYFLGQAGGVESVTLVQQQMPSHNHFINVNNSPASATFPGGNYLAVTKGTGTSPPNYDTYAGSPTAAAQLNPNAVSLAGSGQPHENRQPYLALNYQIALVGIYPSRS